MLWTLESQRCTEVRAARLALADGEIERAASCVGRAEELRQGADTARLAGIVALCRRDFAGAFREYYRARGLAETAP
jgi:hypothetical protein